MRLKTLLRYSWKGVRRGGQRTLIAVLSIAFGVMSLVAMSTLAQEVARVLLVDERQAIGGDAHLWRGTEFLSNESVEQITGLQAGGRIAKYTLAAVSNALVLQVPGSGRVTFLRNGIGIDPEVYPLVGEISLGAPEGAVLAEVLQRPDDTVVTVDVARERDLSVDDFIRVTNRIGGVPVELRVAGIAASTPSYQGGRLYYGRETAAMITGHPEPVTDVFVLWGQDHVLAQAELQESGWHMRTAEATGEPPDEVRATFDFMLKGAGILGLMVGGIGIANTMQVLLARRKEEVAILKSVGYSRRAVVLMFVVETAVIGLVGSGLGVAAAAALSLGLVSVVAQIVTLFLTWCFSPALAVGGFMAGTVTAVIFALHAILQASEVRPATLFRDSTARPGRQWPSTLALYGLMAVPFAVLTSLILGSAVQGVGILLIALAGLIVLGLLLGGTMWVALRLLPTFRFYLLRMARNNMRRRGFSLVWAMIALFIGVFTLGLSITVISASVDEYARRTFSTTGYNLVVIARRSEEGAIRVLTAEHPIHPVNVRYEAPVEIAMQGVPAEVLEEITPMLQGRAEQLWDVSIDGPAWGSRPDGAYLPRGSKVPVGSGLTVTGTSGRSKRLTVLGFYSPLSWDEGLVYPAGGLLVEEEVVLELGGEAVSILVAGEAPPAELSRIGDEIGRALPQTTVITSIDVDNTFSSTLRNLFVFAVCMAGLALAAGAILIANAVSLVMMGRRYEIGVLKAMGYSRQQVLQVVVMEYGLVALIASLAGLAGVELLVVVLQYVEQTAGELLHVDPATGTLIVLVGVGLAVLTVLWVAWRPTQVRPLAALNRNT
jgi:putative ABC transport system permease protein